MTGKVWKRLAEDMSAALNAISRYLGTSTMNYQTSNCLLDCNRTLIISDTVDSHTTRMLPD